MPWGSPQTPASSLVMFPGCPFWKDNGGTHRLATAAVQAADSPLPLRSHIHTSSCENLAIRVGLRNHCLGAAPLVGSQFLPALRPPPVSQRWGSEEATCVVTGLQRAPKVPQSLASVSGREHQGSEKKVICWAPTTSVLTRMQTHVAFTLSFTY